MATTVVNFDGLSAEAAEKMASSLALGVTARVNAVTGFVGTGEIEVRPEIRNQLAHIAEKLAEGGGGGCGIGCC
jgi:hypothetical protein